MNRIGGKLQWPAIMKLPAAPLKPDPPKADKSPPHNIRHRAQADK